jgi:hypothetical protein
MDNRFKYHSWLRPIALEDVRFLVEKDTSYGASWKISGGRSAWFMLLRKMDRMRELMRYRGLPNTVIDALRMDDIFEMIKAQPDGGDGSMLAEVRDLRRYLLLVEAEMVEQKAIAFERPGAEGASQHANRPGTPEDGGHHANQEIDPNEEITGASRASLTGSGGGGPGYMLPEHIANEIRIKVGEGGSTGGCLTGSMEDGIPANGRWKFLMIPWKGASYPIVDRNYYPAHALSHLPRIPKELNSKEHENQPLEYQGLYTWNAVEGKWKLPQHYWECWAK